MATVAARSVLRLATASSRSAVIRRSAGVKPKAAPSPFGISSRTPLTARIFRTPVELSGISLVSMLPYHTATASALLNSMLSVAPRGQAWTLEDCKDDV
ncbi:protein NUCLEAR FUSION DEFECTIVE 6, mitochondrial-like isoform X2 [Henckelia pumila]|uniref:protein NUCLEAR FUSION DEFECTIVE 6, mitochondrial-like isoform X2 n=1 Tax=Henckelia pumila TaxID=405737 RepID=UPI003C6DE9A4